MKEINSSDNFNGKTVGDTVPLFNEKTYETETVDTYYLYIWLDSAETSSSTMYQSFDLSIDGECTNVEIETGNSTSVYQEEILNGVGPELATGMIPVTISNNGTVTTVSPLDSSWYSYENKQWANIVLVTDSSRSNYYESDGITIKANQTILEENILAYYVWIPKYSYKMNGTEQSISISFNRTPEGYIEHPAFNFDGDINGLWVGKFETGHLTLSSSTTTDNLGCTDENCANSDGLIIKPNVEALRRNRVSNFFYASRSMKKNGNPFGLDSSSVDTHMMKNSEWGAVAYLSHSQYGINTEIRINNNREYITGCGASTANGSSSVSCEITYGGVSDGTYPQSTTGNITGIFDMSGGSYEYVMGYYSGSNSNYATSPDTYFGYMSSVNYAGFTSKPAAKYWDEYTTTTSTTACSGGICYGHALSETTSWYLDYAYFVIQSGPWFMRGGYYDDIEGAGAFCSDIYSGNAYSDFGFRSVIIKEA